MWNEVCDKYFDQNDKSGNKCYTQKRKHFKIPRTIIGWWLKSRYYKVMCYIATMYDNGMQRLHLENGIILDFATRTIISEKEEENA